MGLKQKVPIDWGEMWESSKKREERRCNLFAPLHEGWLELNRVQFFGMDAAGKPEPKRTIDARVRRWVTLTKMDLRWCEQEKDSKEASPVDEDDDESLEEMMRGLQSVYQDVASPERLVQRSKYGKM